jgi:ABC-type Fe3+/spermidine/putrescine transport system ATPase subunit
MGDPVAIAVRPERIRLTAGAPGAAGANAFPGTVEECIFRGPTRRYRVRLPHGRVWSVDEAAAGRPVALPVGAAVWVKWEPADCLAIPDA